MGEVALSFKTGSMKFCCFLCVRKFSVLLLPFLILPARCLASPEARQGEVVILRADDSSKVAKQASALGLERIFFKGNKVERVLLPGSALPSIQSETTDNIEPLLQFCRKLVAEGIATHCSPNYRYHAFDLNPNDPKFSSQWGLSKIQAPSAWDTSVGTTLPVVAVIDSGVQYSHPDLQPNIWSNSGEIPDDGIDNDGNGYVDDVNGYNWVSKNSNPDDDNQHGTHVAGTIGAVGNNGFGVAGVNHTVRIQCLKVLDDKGSGYTSDIASAVIYAASNGANVINMSLGGSSPDEVFRAAIVEAGEKGVLVVVAAGNESSNNDTRPSYPANYGLPNMISVAATDENDALADFSNYGAAKVDIAAPGVRILSTVPNSYASFSGTSMASPHVAGVAALIKAVNSSLGYATIKSLILNQADTVSQLTGMVQTGGRLNALRSVSASIGVSPVDPVPTPAPRTGSGVDGLDIQAQKVGSRQYMLSIFAYKFSDDEEDYSGVRGAAVSLSCRENDGSKRTLKKRGTTDREGYFDARLKFTGSKATCSATSSDGRSSRKLSLKIRR